MPSPNRTITLATDPASRGILDSELNTLQDSVVMSLEANQEEDGLPASFLGAKWIYGEFTVPANDSVCIDMQRNFWRNEHYDYRQRNCTIFVCTVGAAAQLPSGTNHKPGNITAQYRATYNTKGGCAVGAPTAVAWNPVASLYFYPDSTYGHFYAEDTGGVTYYLYVMACFTPPINAAIVGDHRQKSMADVARVTSKFINDYEDEANFLAELNKEEDGLPATFLGGTWLYGEYTINNGVNKILDNSRDWRNATILMFYRDGAAAANLPSGASHTPGMAGTADWMCWNLQAGMAIGGPFVANDPDWEAVVNVHFYADNTNGFLYCTNASGAAIYVYFHALLTPAIS